MADTFKYDLFLSHSAKDKQTVRVLAERLRDDGLRVWFDEWEVKPGDSIPSKIEEGLEQSRVLLFCMSANAFGSDWASLESYTFRFRDPLNKERRFIPLRLDTADIKGSLAQFAYIDWTPSAREATYPTLLEACRPPRTETIQERESDRAQFLERVISLGHTGPVYSVVFSPDGRQALSGSSDNTVRLWEVASGQCLKVMEGHGGWVRSVSFSPDGRQALSGSSDQTVRLWEVTSGQCLKVMEGHGGWVRSVSFSPDGRQALSGSNDQTVRLWEVTSGRCLKVMEGHRASVLSVSFSSDGRQALSGSDDNTVRLWEVTSGRCLKVMEGHGASVLSVSFSPDGRQALSGSEDKTVRLWEVASGLCLTVMEGHGDRVWSVLFSPDGRQALSGALNGVMRVWDLSGLLTGEPVLPQVQYECKGPFGGRFGGGKDRAFELSCSRHQSRRRQTPPLHRWRLGDPMAIQARQKEGGCRA